MVDIMHRSLQKPVSSLIDNISVYNNFTAFQIDRQDLQ